MKVPNGVTTDELRALSLAGFRGEGSQPNSYTGTRSISLAGFRGEGSQLRVKLRALGSKSSWVQR